MTTHLVAPPSTMRPLLVAATAPGATALGAWQEWFTGVVIDDLPHEEARLLPQVFANLHANGLDAGLPRRMRGKYRWLWSTNHLQAGELRPLLDSLTAAGAAPLLLQGAALLASGRVEWGARELGSVSIAVRPDQLARAARVLRAQGWAGARGVDERFLVERLALRLPGWRFVRDDQHLDLRWHVHMLRRDGVVDADVWGHARDVPFGDGDAKVPDDVGLLLHLVEQVGHSLDPASPAWVVDAALVAAAVEPSAFVRRARLLGLVTTAAGALAAVAHATGSQHATALATALSTEGGSRWERAWAWTDTGRLGRAAGGRRFEVARVSELVRQLLVYGSTPRTLVTGVRSVARRRFEPHLRGRRGGPLPPGEWVELDQGPGIERVAGRGWTWPDITGTWAEGARATLVLDTLLPRGGDVAIELRGGVNANCSHNPIVGVSVNGARVAEWDVREVFVGGPQRIVVPAAVADRQRPIEVTFRPRHTYRPSSRGEEPGDRQPFLNLFAVRVCPAP